MTHPPSPPEDQVFSLFREFWIARVSISASSPTWMIYSITHNIKRAFKLVSFPKTDNSKGGFSSPGAKERDGVTTRLMKMETVTLMMMNPGEWFRQVIIYVSIPFPYLLMFCFVLFLSRSNPVGLLTGP